MNRKPIAAGEMYPSNPEELEAQVDRLVEGALVQGTCKAALVPHAEYDLAGTTAGYAFKAMPIDKTVVILTPDHTRSALGNNCVYYKGSWKTPLGNMEVDEEVASKLVDAGLDANCEPHEQEYAAEVCLPFLQRIGVEKFVPVIVGSQSYDNVITVANALQEVDVFLLATANLSHHVPHYMAVKNDFYCLQAVEDMDEEEFMERTTSRAMGSCGTGIISTAMRFSRSVNSRGQLVKYSTSAEMTGDNDNAVGYATVLFR